jgi:hypothetical protein
MSSRPPAISTLPSGNGAATAFARVVVIDPTPAPENVLPAGSNSSALDKGWPPPELVPPAIRTSPFGNGAATAAKRAVAIDPTPALEKYPGDDAADALLAPIPNASTATLPTQAFSITHAPTDTSPACHRRPRRPRITLIRRRLPAVSTARTVIR